jgi:hypothetical protein
VGVFDIFCSYFGIIWTPKSPDFGAFQRRAP